MHHLKKYQGTHRNKIVQKSFEKMTGKAVVSGFYLTCWSFPITFFYNFGGGKANVKDYHLQ